MLAPLDPVLLDRIEFPLGTQTKTVTRAEAGAAGLEVAERRESQEACFLAGDDYRAFLERRGLLAADGPIVDENGRELGRHEGVWRYTPGQRRGIGVAAPEPLYALRSDPLTNTLVVGPRGSLACSEVRVEGSLHTAATRVEAKLRYRSPALPARVAPTQGGFTLELEEPAFGVARGQVVALYDGDVVVGSGVVSSARRN
jgi:tRNA-uridine 2-sulfurtransferase